MANKIVFKSYEDARKFMHEQHLHGVAKFIAWKDRPGDIPSNPAYIYKNEWKGWGDFLGYEAKKGRQKKDWMPYTEAKTFVKALNLTCTKDWLDYCSSGDKPENLPSNPKATYSEFEGTEAFFGFKPAPRGRKPKSEVVPPTVAVVPEEQKDEEKSVASANNDGTISTES
jgi:hypothetical protein